LGIIFKLISRAQTQFKTSLRKQIERGCLAGEQRRMPEIVVEHQTSDAQGAGGLGGRSESRDRGQVRGHMVGHEEDIIAKIFRLTRFVSPGSSRTAFAGCEAKAKWFLVKVKSGCT
jgi:hypothetical protein